MKLLLLTQYYPPEIGAPQNRLHELAIRLQALGVQVEVLTALPNYPKMEIHEAYRKGKLRSENIDGIPVFRSWIYVSKKSSIFHRLLNYFSFVISAYWKGRKRGPYDFLLVESPPLFLGWTAMKLSKKMKAKLIFNVSDLWPESAEKLQIVTNRLLLNLAYRLEKKCYQKAQLVTGQTQGIVENIKGRFPHKEVYWLPNGVDLEFYNPEEIDAGNFREKHGFKPDDLLFFYGGILGHAQGLEVIIHAASMLKDLNKVHFIIQGEGPLKTQLMNLASSIELPMVHFLPAVSKAEMPGILKAVDVALVPLRNLPLFQGAIPSKVFEALAMKVPLLLGVEGEAKTHFIDKAKAGWHFEPENASDLAENIRYIHSNPFLVKEYGENARNYVDQVFNRNRIALDFFAQINRIYQEPLA
jgi:glycosyltransferase involved in cell wall biosynthesis